MAMIAIRCARIALDQGGSGAIDTVCGFLFKHPPKPMADAAAYEALAAFSQSATAPK
jgi:myo-inositol-1-phosphate synthase